MNIFQTLILSLIEGFTEFLPISSTGHLILTTEALNIPHTEFVKSFLIIIQLGAVSSVIVLYYKTLLNTKIWPKILAAFIPSAFLGFVLYRLIKDNLLENSLITVIALILGGIAFILIERVNKKETIIKIEDIDMRTSFVIGLFQSISVIPGVSRAGATILGSLLLGANRKTAAEFSFILAIPTMIGATALDISQTKLSFSQNELSMLIIGLVGSFLFALLAVKLLVRYVSTHSFTAFGVYRIIVGIVFWFLFLR